MSEQPTTVAVTFAMTLDLRASLEKSKSHLSVAEFQAKQEELVQMEYQRLKGMRWPEGYSDADILKVAKKFANI